ncbi:MAG: Holliday junction resolvase RuvX [Wenzhouxiangellaceae bacterium]
MPESRSPVVLGLDFGSRRIGVASGNTVTGTAQPVTTITHQGQPWDALQRVIEEWQPGHLIVGLPLNADGSDSPFSLKVREFAQELGQRHPALKVVLQDERLSSRAAQTHFTAARQRGQSRRRDADRLDAMAAAVIVESWLAGHSGPAT